MFVRCERFKKAAPLHQHEARAVNKTPFLVLPLREELPGLFIQRCINMNDLDVRRCFQTGDEPNDCRSRNPKRAGQQRDQFREDVVGRNEFSALLPTHAIDRGWQPEHAVLG